MHLSLVFFQLGSPAPFLTFILPDLRPESQIREKSSKKDGSGEFEII